MELAAVLKTSFCSLAIPTARLSLRGCACPIIPAYNDGRLNRVKTCRIRTAPLRCAIRSGGRNALSRNIPQYYCDMDGWPEDRLPCPPSSCGGICAASARRVRLGHAGARLAPPKAKLAEQPLALPHSKINCILWQSPDGRPKHRQENLTC